MAYGKVQTDGHSDLVQPVGNPVQQNGDQPKVQLVGTALQRQDIVVNPVQPTGDQPKVHAQQNPIIAVSYIQANTPSDQPKVKILPAQQQQQPIFAVNQIHANKPSDQPKVQAIESQQKTPNTILNHGPSIQVKLQATESQQKTPNAILIYGPSSQPKVQATESHQKTPNTNLPTGIGRSNYQRNFNEEVKIFIKEIEILLKELQSKVSGPNDYQSKHWSSYAVPWSISRSDNYGLRAPWSGSSEHWPYYRENYGSNSHRSNYYNPMRNGADSPEYDRHWSPAEYSTWTHAPHYYSSMSNWDSTGDGERRPSSEIAPSAQYRFWQPNESYKYEGEQTSWSHGGQNQWSSVFKY